MRVCQVEKVVEEHSVSAVVCAIIRSAKAFLLGDILVSTPEGNPNTKAWLKALWILST